MSHDIFKKPILWDKSGQLNQALNMLEEINEAGYALAPLQPTPAMIQAAATHTGLAPLIVEQVYLAMLSAAGDEMALKT